MPHSQEHLLSTHDLQERGWTTGMIQKLLPEPDRTKRLIYPRPQMLRFYAEERVREAESGDLFAMMLERSIQAQERAERARETRRLRIMQQIQQHARGFHAGHLRQVLSPAQIEHLAALERTSSRLVVWGFHQADIRAYQQNHAPGNAGKLHGPELERQLLIRVREVLQECYPWVYSSSR